MKRGKFSHAKIYRHEKGEHMLIRKGDVIPLPAVVRSVINLSQHYFQHYFQISFKLTKY